MSFATDGDTEDLGPAYRRGPISVAQLLEREGFQPATRSRATRRALTGVAAGAVLALGAVVGSLLLNHGTENTADDTLASGNPSGGDIVLAQTGQSPTLSTARPTTPANQAATANATNTGKIVRSGSTGHAATAATSRTTHRGTSASGGSTVGGTGRTMSGGSGTASAPTTSTSTSTSTSTPSTSSSAPSTQSSPTSDSTASSSPSTSSPSTSSPSTSPSTSSSGNGGLLGAVTGTVTGTLSSVTDPVFNWFG